MVSLRPQDGATDHQTHQRDPARPVHGDWKARTAQRGTVRVLVPANRRRTTARVQSGRRRSQNPESPIPLLTSVKFDCVAPDLSDSAAAAAIGSAITRPPEPQLSAHALATIRCRAGFPRRVAQPPSRHVLAVGDLADVERLHPPHARSSWLLLLCRPHPDDAVRRLVHLSHPREFSTGSLWPYKSPVIAIDECPSRSAAALMWVPRRMK